MLEDLELFVTERLFLRIGLEAPALVLEVNKLTFAHIPVRGDSPRQRNFAALGVMGSRLGAILAGNKFVFERVDTPGSQGIQFGLALFDQ